MSARKVSEQSGLTRRATLKLAGKLAGAAAALPLLPAGALAQTSATTGRSHGMSIFGDLKNSAGFSHFDYVDPDAPKGGRFIFQVPNWNWNQNPSTFNTLNSFVAKGDAPPRMELTFDTLMVAAADEPDSLYGLVAESVEISDDGNALRFFLRQDARFHDASPLTAHDAAFSLNLLKKDGHPSFSLTLKQMVSAQAVSDHELLVRLSGEQSGGLKLLIAAVPILSSAYYGDKDFAKSTMQAPLGSGPYRVGRFDAGRFIEYERVDDYWARDLPVMRGTNNFDIVRVEFFRDRTAGFEAFKKGDITFHEEFTSKTWATAYDFPAIEDGRVKKELVPSERLPSFQAWYFNTRLEKFADPRTRQAIGLAFDFEWVNKNLFFDAYSRASSFFGTSDYVATGEIPAEELELLEPFRDRLPDAVFRDPYVPPQSDGSGRDRKQLREAVRLLKDAGWTRNGAKLVDGKGQPFNVEFLIRSPTFERVLGSFVAALKSIGIEATIRLVDAAQYQARQNEFDYDILGGAASMSPTPQEELKSFLTSESADTPGTRNFSGIKDPVVDALIDKVLAAKDRTAHRTALRALDRVLRASHYVIPEWFGSHHRIAMWDMFDRPKIKPDYAFPVETTWWYDSAKAARIGKT